MPLKKIQEVLDVHWSTLLQVRADCLSISNYNHELERVIPFDAKIPRAPELNWFNRDSWDPEYEPDVPEKTIAGNRFYWVSYKEFEAICETVSLMKPPGDPAQKSQSAISGTMSPKTPKSKQSVRSFRSSKSIKLVESP